MAVKIRLARAGAKKAPFYRIVAADSRAPRDGRFIEILGRYNPRVEPSLIEIDIERAEAWLGKGAQMTQTVARLFKVAKDPAATPPPSDVRPSKKSQARAAVAAQESPADDTSSSEEAAASAEEPADEDT
ncbi:MAG TPA: 30S ribosomal protein S16 [Coriobacteriia bacterium]|nr:30S ribosomal protein S16 [Coriobacteriia bacterium]